MVVAFGEDLGADLWGLEGWVIGYFDKIGCGALTMVCTVGWWRVVR